MAFDPKFRFRIFIDEVGTQPNKDVWPPAEINERYMSLTGVIVSTHYLYNALEPDFRLMRNHHFGPDCGPLHRREIVNKKGIYRKLQEPMHRRAWGDDFLSFVRRHSFATITVVLDRVEWTDQFARRFDPYMVLMERLLTEYYLFLDSCDAEGDVFAEGRGKYADEEVRSAYKHFYEHGPFDVPNADIQERLTSRKISIKPKEKDLVGLQLADLLASALKRSILQELGVLTLDNFTNFQRELLRRLWAHRVLRGQRGGLRDTGIIYLRPPIND